MGEALGVIIATIITPHITNMKPNSPQVQLAVMGIPIIMSPTPESISIIAVAKADSRMSQANQTV